MPVTIREQVLAAFLARLQTIAGVTVERNRDTEVQRFPTLVQVDGGQTVNLGTAGIAFYTATIEVEGYVTAATPNELGPALNDLYGRTVQAAVADPTLGGVAVDLRERDMTVVVDRGQGRQPNGAFTVGFEIDFFTAPLDPHAPAP